VESITTVQSTVVSNLHGGISSVKKQSLGAIRSQSITEAKKQAHSMHQVTQDAAYGGPHKWQISWWARSVRRLWRYRAYTRWVEKYCTSLNVKGLENLENLPSNAIFVPNHQSHMDTLVFHAALPEKHKINMYFGAAADRWFVKGRAKVILQPWYQSLVLGNFPIHRGGGSRTLQYARWLLSHGCHLCIFPEGTRTAGEKLGQFKLGPALLATQKQVPIIPVVLKGLHGMRPKGQLEVEPGSAEVVFLEPLWFPIDVDVQKATNLVWSRMNAELEGSESGVLAHSSDYPDTQNSKQDLAHRSAA